MPLRDYKETSVSYQQDKKRPDYQNYQATTDTQDRLRELKFFSNIVAFSICCVLIAFVLLTLEQPTPVAFGLSIPLAFLAHQGIKLAIQTLKIKAKNSKN